MIFWHESSATEPGGTARDGRAHERGAANLPAMSVAGAAPLVGVPQAGRGERGGSRDYGADRSEHPFAAEVHELLKNLPVSRSHICYSAPKPTDRPTVDF